MTDFLGLQTATIVGSGEDQQRHTRLWTACRTPVDRSTPFVISGWPEVLVSRSLTDYLCLHALQS